MKIKSRFFLLLFITGLLFATFIACDKTDDPASGDQNDGTLKDADGNVYKTVIIGTQTWIVENLRTTKYNDGTEIPNVSSDSQWENLSTGAYCNYDNLESYADIYGRLYNWFAVNSGKLAPTGWHIATDEDWTILINYLIDNGYNQDGSTDENKYAKSIASNTLWSFSDKPGSPGANLEENNCTGFSALPGGFRFYNGEFESIGEGGNWWSSTEINTDFAFFRFLYSNSRWLEWGGSPKRYGFSVRLVKDN
jgi:uncharacterized protein (TIGR02145 family)